MHRFAFKGIMYILAKSRPLRDVHFILIRMVALLDCDMEADNVAVFAAAFPAIQSGQRCRGTGHIVRQRSVRLRGPCCVSGIGGKRPVRHVRQSYGRAVLLACCSVSRAKLVPLGLCLTVSGAIRVLSGLCLTVSGANRV